MPSVPFWIADTPHGALATARCPASEHYLETNLAEWKTSGAHIVVSLLGDAETAALGLEEEGNVCAHLGLAFHRFPITDHGLPASDDEFVAFIDQLHAESVRQRGIVAHCYAGIGRSTLVAASLMVRGGVPLGDTLLRISDARQRMVPDTPSQAMWLQRMESKIRHGG